MLLPIVCKRLASITPSTKALGPGKVFSTFDQSVIAARQVTKKSKQRPRFAVSLLVVVGLLSQGAYPQRSPTTHTLTFSNSAETIDELGRRVLVSDVKGDLPGVLTLALVIQPDGSVTSGEWALNVSYIQLGPPDADGDGDASESLVQRGVIKGSVNGGIASIAPGGLATSVSGIQLTVTGATLEFAGATLGNGLAMGSSLNQQGNSNGLLSITF